LCRVENVGSGFCLVNLGESDAGGVALPGDHVIAFAFGLVAVGLQNALGGIGAGGVDAFIFDDRGLNDAEVDHCDDFRVEAFDIGLQQIQACDRVCFEQLHEGHGGDFFLDHGITGNSAFVMPGWIEGSDSRSPVGQFIHQIGPDAVKLDSALRGMEGGADGLDGRAAAVVVAQPLEHVGERLNDQAAGFVFAVELEKLVEADSVVSADLDKDEGLTAIQFALQEALETCHSTDGKPRSP